MEQYEIMEQYRIMEQYGIMDCLDHPTDFCFALTVSALVNNTEADLEAAVLYQRGAPPRNNHPGLQKPPVFPNPPNGSSFSPSGSSAAPAAARRGRPGPAAADGGEGRCGAGGPPASPPVTPPGPPGRLPASLRCLPGPSVLGRPSPSWIRGAAAAVARSVSAPIASFQRLPHGPGPGRPAGPPLRGAGGAGTMGLAVWGWVLLWDGASLSLVFLLVLISWGLSGGTGRGL